MASDLRIEINQASVERAIGFLPGTEQALITASDRIANQANALSSGFRTGIWHDHDTGEERGNTPTMYGADVFKGRKGYIGIVHPENYAAMKDNYLHNTMLKARG